LDSFLPAENLLQFEMASTGRITFQQPAIGQEMGLNEHICSLPIHDFNVLLKQLNSSK
jgi:hypothetical protein